MKAFQNRLPALLEEGLRTLEAWGADLGQLRFAAKVAPIPRF
jgi:hypothetical protein